ncbi:MAG: lytic transglycosylase domain-containing protein, partial [Bdellovibrionales bacterium]|nr:lytic transglycosylase domain-containing protein [Bdellovibrionales bacterium]
KPSLKKLTHTPPKLDEIYPQFDLPIIYNSRVKNWITYFQGRGRKWFGTWLSRSNRYLPAMQGTLRKKSLPQDLAYVAMIESGFSPHAVSSASAVGYWQFIRPTANRYGLQTNWWIDERRDFAKSTIAAARYLEDLFRIFKSWYLTAAAYNMGEGRLKKLTKKYRTNNFWILANKPDFPKETRDYIPKLIATMLIAKAPGLYGFHNIEKVPPHEFDYFSVPGGTDLVTLAEAIGVSQSSLRSLNPELIHGFVPRFVRSHRIRVPQGFTMKVSQFVRQQL